MDGISRRIDPWLGRPALTAWLLSGVLAGLYGWVRFVGYFRTEALVYSRWLSGEVVYPAGNPAAVALYETVTPFHGLIGLLSSAGLGDLAITQLCCAVNVAVYAQATALMVFALSRNVPAAVLLGIAQAATTGFLQGTDYPIVIVNNEKLLGSLGLGLQLQIFGLIGLGRQTPALALVAVLTVVHPVFAAFNAALVVAVRVTNRFGAGQRLWSGGALLGAAMAAWALLRASRPEVDLPPPADPRLVEAYFNLWDAHRNTPLTVYGLITLAESLAGLGLILLLCRRGGERLRAMTTALAMAGALGIACWIGFNTLRPWLPPLLLIPMPNRLMNVSEALVFPVVAGLLLALRPRVLPRVGLAGLVVVMLGCGVALDMGEFSLVDPVRLNTMAGTKLALTAVVIVLAWALATGRVALAEVEEKTDSTSRHPALAAAWLAVGGAVLGIGLSTRSPDPFAAGQEVFDRLAKSEGVVLGLENINLTKSPIRNAELFSFPCLDVLAYTPRLIPQVAQIMADVYGGDFFNPPKANYRIGVYNVVDMQAMARRSTEEWKALGAQYGFHFIVTLGGRELALPKVDMGRIRIFIIPQD